MGKLTAWQMYNLLLDQKMIVAVMVNDEDGATEITSRVERCGKYAFDNYELDRVSINPYSSADRMLVTMYLDEYEEVPEVTSADLHDYMYGI